MKEISLFNGLKAMISWERAYIPFVDTGIVSIIPLHHQDWKSSPAGHWLMPIRDLADCPGILNRRIRKGK
jgi:hypothetical protein